MVNEWKIGNRYMLRSGAVVRLTYIHPFKDYSYKVGIIERLTDGEIPELEYKVSCGPDGMYCATLDNPSPLDWISEVQELGAFV